MAIDFESAMAGLFSAAVVALGGDPSGLKGDLHPAERVLVERAVAKRRLDFVAGRSLARRALRELGCDEMPLLAGARREPLWPDL
jgi:4'-phosphopantetheinyl transferase EntD